MASFSAVRTALATRLATITSLHVYDTIPGTVEVPAAIVTVPSGQFVTYDTAMARGADDLTFSVLLLVSPADDGIAQDALDAYLAGSGALSIKTAVEGDPDLGNTADYVVVSGASDYGLHDVAGISYWGCRFPVTIGVVGT
jgi:hypothetical protein